MFMFNSSGSTLCVRHSSPFSKFTRTHGRAPSLQKPPIEGRCLYKISHSGDTRGRVVSTGLGGKPLVTACDKAGGVGVPGSIYLFFRSNKKHKQMSTHFLLPILPQM